MKQIVILLLSVAIGCVISKPNENGLATGFTGSELGEDYLAMEMFKYLESDYSYDSQIYFDPNSDVFNSINHESMKSIIGGKALANHKELISYYIENRKSIILINLDQESKSFICSLVNGCSKIGNHKLMAVIPKTLNGVDFHCIFNWVGNSNDSISSYVYNANQTTYTINKKLNDIQVDIEPIAKQLIYKLTSVGDGPVASLVPPANVSIPFGFVQTVDAAQFIFVDPINQDIQQTFSHRIDNNYYIYKDLVNNINNFALVQNSFAYPGSPLIINKPTSALGFFQFEFSFNNDLSYNGQPLDSNFNLQATSPPTVDQTHIITTESTTTTTISISFSIDPSTGSGGGSYTQTWSDKTTSTQQVADWGVNEQTDPFSMSTGWIYHQQLPYDIYTLGATNFPTWWSDAYCQGLICGLEPLSISTLQSSTSSVWSVNSNLVDANDELIVDITLNAIHGGALIANPGFIDSHHKLFYNQYQSSIDQTINVNYFTINK